MAAICRLDLWCRQAPVCILSTRAAANPFDAVLTAIANPRIVCTIRITVATSTTCAAKLFDAVITAIALACIECTIRITVAASSAGGRRARPRCWGRWTRRWWTRRWWAGRWRTGTTAQTTTVDLTGVLTQALDVRTVTAISLLFVRLAINVFVSATWRRSGCRVATLATLVWGARVIAEGIRTVITPLGIWIVCHSNSGLRILRLEHVFAVFLRLFPHLQNTLRRPAPTSDVLPTTSHVWITLSFCPSAGLASAPLVGYEILAGHAHRPLASSSEQTTIPLQSSRVGIEISAVWASESPCPLLVDEIENLSLKACRCVAEAVSIFRRQQAELTSLICFHTHIDVACGKIKAQGRCPFNRSTSRVAHL